MIQRDASLGWTLFLIFLAAGSAQAVQPVALDKDPNLAAWWKFDETTGKTAADASPHGRNGTLKGNLSFETNSAPGKTGKAIRLEGGDSLVEISDYKGVTGTRPRTVSAWIKTARTRGRIISWGTNDFGKMWNFGFVRGRVGVTPHGGYLYMNAETHDDEWHHVAAVVREAELPNLHDDVTLYLDGAIAEIHDIGLLDLWPLETGNELDVRIGPGFQGCLDDVRIYNRPLTDEEVYVLFRLESNRPIPKAGR
ncbi:MAG: LamG domain-containing protein [Phycisphaerales bacterium]|nr:MAG: LamG domain-containing protein [Phycisphaerales bacterium]